MSGRWWRAYSRARHDAKLLKLTDRQFRWWFNLVCVASENGGTLPPHADLSAEFRVSGKTTTEMLDALIAAGLFEHTDEGIRPHNWNTLQYVSDSSSNRVKQFRERRRNVSETPSESEADTETDSVPHGTGAPAPQFDPVKAMFDDGVRLLGDTGTPEKHARSLIGKWRKSHGDEACREAINAAFDNGITQPIEWIEKRLGGPKIRETWDQRRIREGLKVIGAA